MEDSRKMSKTVQCTGTPVDPSIPFSILDLKAQAVRLPVSKGAQILLSELLTWSGERGYCWWSNKAIAKDLKWSSSSVWRRTAELQEAGFLASIPRPGRSNYWVPLPGPAKMTRLENELTPLADSRCPFLKENEKLKRCTVQRDCASTEEAPPPPDHNVNAVEVNSKEISLSQAPQVRQPIEVIEQPIPAPQQIPIPKPTPTEYPKFGHKPSLTPEHLFLVDEIERVTGDTWSRGHFINLVRQTDENTIYTALSVTRDKMSLESGVNGGAYFTATLKVMQGLSCLSPSSAKNNELSLDDRLRHLERDYPHLLVSDLFSRYVELKTDGVGSDPVDYIGSYEKFLHTHHEEIYTTKPAYRREVNAA
jgi:hypothetical protein